eukprot:EG_transcript_500
MHRIALPLLLLLGCLAAPGGALLPWAPGLALALNVHTNTDVAVTRLWGLARSFTLEYWSRGASPSPAAAVHAVIATAAGDPVAVLLAGRLALWNQTVLWMVPCDPFVWCHRAISVDLSAFPLYSVAYYLNGSLVGRADGTFASVGPTPSPSAPGALVEALDRSDLTLGFGGPLPGGLPVGEPFTGHLDEIRLWNAVLSPANVSLSYRRRLPLPVTNATAGNLSRYYPFDGNALNATCVLDEANPGTPSCLYVTDSSDSMPFVLPPPSTIAALTVSTAPICAAGAGLWVRVTPGASVALPVASLVCDALGPITWGVLSDRGGVLTAEADSDGVQSLRFTPTGLTLTPDAGFVVRVSDGQGSVVEVSISVLPNHLPQLSGPRVLYGVEDQPLAQWLVVADEDNDLAFLEMVHLPAPDQGQATLDTPLQRTVTFTPAANVFGANAASFAVRARDQWNGTSPAATVAVSLAPMSDAPTLAVQTHFTIFRWQRVEIPFSTVDVDGRGVAVVVSDWPAASQGTLMGVEDDRQWSISSFVLSSHLEWARSVTAASSILAPVSPTTDNTTGRIVLGWSPATVDGNCTARAPPPPGGWPHPYTEFVEVDFDVPLYLTDVLIYANMDNRVVAQILVPDGTGGWSPIHRCAAPFPPSAPSASPGVPHNAPICHTVQPVARLRLELDTCGLRERYQLQSLRVRGGTVPPANVLNSTAQLYFQPDPTFTGEVTFGLTATACYSDLQFASDLRTIRITVLDPIPTMTVAVHDNWTPIDVSTAHAGQPNGSVQVLLLPQAGVLQYGGQRVTAVAVDLPAAGTVFQYQASQCNAQTQDSFVVWLGPNSTVTVAIAGCDAQSISNLGVIVGIPVGLLLLVPVVLLLRLWRQRNQRDNSRAPKNATDAICIMFTDIQSSTKLWTEMPEEMSMALEVHHTVIRKLIRRFKCYEVKTIGDAFMIVTRDPVAAVRLALSIQETLFDEYGPGTAIDCAYRKHAECPLSMTEYNSLWRGLRVRVGIHMGRVQIVRDSVTKGYDYYGPVVNAAARIEAVAHGGQILVSSLVYDRITRSPGELNWPVATKALGPQTLRGLRAPIEVVEILPARFLRRCFPPLRLDHIQDDDDDLGPDLEQGGGPPPVWDFGSIRRTRYPYALEQDVLFLPMVREGELGVEQATSMAFHVYYTLKAMLSTAQGEARWERLRQVCQYLNVPLMVVNEGSENTAVGKLTMQMLGIVARQPTTQVSRMVWQPTVDEVDEMSRQHSAALHFGDKAPPFHRVNTAA